MELEQLLNTLADPFTTKKQLPRTPESLSKFLLQFFKKEFNDFLQQKKNIQAKLLLGFSYIDN